MSEPSASRILYKRLNEARLPVVVETTVAALLRGLVSSTQGGVYLLAGKPLAAYSGWVLDGMDINSRLIVNLPADCSPATINSCFDMDLRISGHVQPLPDFLTDVAKHRFALAAIDLALYDVASGPAIWATLTQLMDKGSWLLLFDEDPDRLLSFEKPRLTDWCEPVMLADGHMQLFCRRAVPVSLRRGGRRGRHGARGATS